MQVAYYLPAVRLDFMTMALRAGLAMCHRSEESFTFRLRVVWSPKPFVVIRCFYLS